MISVVLICLILPFVWCDLLNPVHKPLQVVVGDEIVIELQENPTTGYTWEFFDDSYTAGGFLSFVSDSRVEAEDAKYGAPSVRRFVFHGEKAGLTHVRFVQTRFGVTDVNAKPESYFVRVVEKADTGMIHPVHKPLEVTVGSEVMIDMVENPTTGYTWEFFDDSYTVGGFLSFVSDSRVGMESTMGASSVHRFIFYGEKTGSTRVRFVQKRFGIADVGAETESYFVHVVEKPDTGMIVPMTSDTGMIYVDRALEVVVGKEFIIDLPKISGYTWKLSDEALAIVSYVVDYVDRSRPEFQRFVFQAEKSGFAVVSFTPVPVGEVISLIYIFPKTYKIHVVEQIDTGMIRPKLRESGIVHPVHKPLQVVVGSEIVIEMAENPTTGYTWEFFDDSYTAGGFLSFVSDSRVEAENIMGAPSVHRFVFHGEKAGSTHVRFVQARFGVVDVEAKPESYFVRVIEQADTGMISPSVDGGMIHPVHKPLQVVVGSEIAIEMVENPSTGYVWSLLDEGYAAEGLLSYVRDEIVKTDGDDGKIVGKSSIHRFVFRGEKSGYTKVAFGMARRGKDLPSIYFIHVVEKPDTGMISPNIAL